MNPCLAELKGEISETDCLSVDIYIPRNSPRSKGEQGILYWIHGGGYQTGDAKYYSGLEQAITYGNIVVQVQYRLGLDEFRITYTYLVRTEVYQSKFDYHYII